jgi:hypothetical protein
MAEKSWMAVEGGRIGLPPRLSYDIIIPIDAQSIEPILELQN